MSSQRPDHSDDEVYVAALEQARSRGKVSVSSLQRGLGVSYNHARSLLDEMKRREGLVQGVSSFTWVFRSPSTTL